MSNDIIKFKRGNETQKPSLLQGEPYFAWDSENLFIGGLSGEIEFLNRNKIPNIKTPEMYEGSSDWERCQKAVDDVLTSGGGVVVLQPGKTYTFTSQCLVIWGSNLTLIGYGSKIIREGTPGYHGDVITVYGKLNNLHYYGYTTSGGFGSGNYNTRVQYTGPTIMSENIKIMGFDVDFNMLVSACNGIGGFNGEFEVIDCIVKNAPQESFVSLITNNKTFAKFKNCKSYNAIGYGYRCIAFDIGLESELSVTFDSCEERGSLTQNPSFVNIPTAMLLRGAGLGKNFSVKIYNCDFENGIQHNAAGGSVVVENSTLKYYYRHSSIVSSDSKEYLRNIILTGDMNPNFNAALRIFNCKDIVIENLDHIYHDGSVEALQIYSFQNMILDGVNKGFIRISIDGMIENSRGVIKNSHIILNDLNTTIATNTRGMITFENNDIDINGSATFNTIANTYIRFINNRIYRRASSIGYFIFRNLVKGIFKNNKLILLGTSPNTEIIALPSKDIVVSHNTIIQTDLNEIVDYGGFTTNAPTTGYRRKGQTTIELNPVAGGYSGYVCITSGINGGMQKGFGLIQI